MASSLDEAVELLQSKDVAPTLGDAFVIGGAGLFAEALTSPACGTVHLTRVRADPECDVFLPAIDTSVFALVDESAVQEEAGMTYTFQTYATAAGVKQLRSRAPGAENQPLAANTQPTSGRVLGAKKADVVEPQSCGGKKEEEAGDAATGVPAAMPGVGADGRHEEMQYLDLIRDIIENGVKRGDRTGTGTLSKFGVQVRPPLACAVPLRESSLTQRAAGLRLRAPSDAV